MPGRCPLERISQSEDFWENIVKLTLYLAKKCVGPERSSGEVQEFNLWWFEFGEFGLGILCSRT